MFSLTTVLRALGCLTFSIPNRRLLETILLIDNTSLSATFRWTGSRSIRKFLNTTCLSTLHSSCVSSILGSGSSSSASSANLPTSFCFKGFVLSFYFFSFGDAATGAIFELLLFCLLDFVVEVAWNSLSSSSTVIWIYCWPSSLSVRMAASSWTPAKVIAVCSKLYCVSSGSRGASRVT